LAVRYLLKVFDFRLEPLDFSLFIFLFLS